MKLILIPMILSILSCASASKKKEPGLDTRVYLTPLIEDGVYTMVGIVIDSPEEGRAEMVIEDSMTNTLSSDRSTGIYTLILEGEDKGLICEAHTNLFTLNDQGVILSWEEEPGCRDDRGLVKFNTPVEIGGFKGGFIVTFEEKDGSVLKFEYIEIDHADDDDNNGSTPAID